MRRLARAVTAALALTAAVPSLAFDGPQGVFVQGGAWTHVRAVATGLMWDWSWSRAYAAGTLTGYTEADLGYWRTTDTSHDSGFTRVGVTPVLRFYPARFGGAWFAELGIGANFIWPRFHSGSHVFSTTFNFGDHVAIGRRFGANGAHELALRFQHFSNARIKEPNPGENFVQLRYVHRF